ncbi:MAG TPA: serine hydrolase domain-containing protein, partial [Longimicrobiales bacterium]
LTHSSGLPGNPPNRVDVDGVMQPYSRADLYAGIRRTVLQFETGGGLGYSNYGFALLGHLLELKTGRTFAQLLQEHILTPVDLRSTSLQLGEAQLRNAALHYWPEDSTWVPRPRWSFGEIAAFGGLSTTIGDLARYATAMLRSDSTILSARSMREMHALQVPRGSWLAGFGYSWFVERNRPQGVLVYHGGEVDGNSAYLAIAPLLNVAIAVMANMGGAAANNLGAEVLAAATDAARRHRTFTADEAQRLFINQHWELAAIAYDGLLTARPDWGVAAFRAGFAWYQLNDHIRALPALQRAADLDFQPGLAAFYAAVITTQRGDHNAAIALLQNAVAKGFKDRRELETNTGLNALRSDERFVRLVKGLEGN